MSFLDPKNDFAFKQIFGTEQNKDILLHLLNDVFANQTFRETYGNIESVELIKLNQYPEIMGLRESIVDVLCKDSEGRQFIVEMQCARDSAFLKRAHVYASRAYLNQMTKGTEYKELKSVIFFAIMKHTIFPKKDSYISHHEFRDVVSGEHDLKEFYFSFLELDKFNKTIDELETNIEKWSYFFKHAPTTKQDESTKLSEDNSSIGNAFLALTKLAATPAELLEYERFAMKQNEIEVGLEDAKLEGMREGEKRGKLEGMREGKLETAKNLLAANMDVNLIASVTELPVEEILALKEKG
jgi:predicted transposase/invertase (TIGR01784 family)